MTDRATFTYSGIMSGVNLALAHLIRELDAKQIISKEEFAHQIEGAIEGCPMKEADGTIRYDRLLIANLVHLLRGPPEWEPRVIQGGLSDQPDARSSDPSKTTP